jgi:hypothetical protein
MNENKQAEEKRERTADHHLTYIHEIVAEESLSAAAESIV